MRTQTTLKPRVGFTFFELLLMIVIIAVLIWALIPAVGRVREAATQTQSANNLKQIGLAAQGFHDAMRRMPFNGTVPAVGGDPRTGSWAFQIIPYIDSTPLFNHVNITTNVWCYMCPGRGRPSPSETGAWTDYFINTWLNDPKNGARQVKLADIIDGTSNTIFVGHGTIDPNLYSATAPFAQSTDIFKGGNPAMARRLTTNHRDTAGVRELNWGGPFPQGSMMVMGDSTVKMFPYTYTGGVITNGVSTPPGLGAFLTPKGGEATVLPD